MVLKSSLCNRTLGCSQLDSPRRIPTISRRFSPATGWQQSVLGMAVGLPFMLLSRAPDGRISGQAMLPFGYFLALATPIVVFFGQALWLGYLGLIG